MLDKFYWVVRDMNSFIFGIFKTKKEAKINAIERSLERENPIALTRIPAEWYRNGKKIKQTTLPSKFTSIDGEEGFTWNPIAFANRQLKNGQDNDLRGL